MQKKSKRIIMLAILILIVLSVVILLINTNGKMPTPLNEQAMAQYTSTIGGVDYSIDNAVTQEPNAPTLSAGMIPVKWDGNYWTITSKDDSSWYNYNNGQPAYVMLNDGTYQSELVRNMTNKKLAEDNLGAQVKANELGSIYMWLPRFAYNEQGEILYIKQEHTVAGTWSMPEIFTYETEKTDLSLAGIWVEYNPLDTESEVTTKVNNMTGEENIYGFIANTKSTAMTTADQTALQTYVGNDALVVPQIIDTTNLNRTILKITNTNKTEPIKAKAYYDETDGKIKVEVTYSKNGTSKIVYLNEGVELSSNSNTADTGSTIIGNGIYNFVIIDKNGSLKEITLVLTELDVYIIKDVPTLKAFRDAVNAKLTTASTKAYQIADIYMNEGLYTKDEETGICTFSEEAEQWIPIADYNITSSLLFEGTYFGGNHTISGIYINSEDDYQALFGRVSGSIYDLGVIDSTITGDWYVSGLVGNLQVGNIENCYSFATLNARSYAGGVAAWLSAAHGNINNCYNTGNITVTQGYAGGISGQYTCTNIKGKIINISNCYNTGNIISNSGNTAGIIGYYSGYNGNNSINITNCYNTGDITGKGSTGGIVGRKLEGVLTIEKCYNTANITDISAYTGGIIGITDSSSGSYTLINSCYNTGAVQTSNNYAGGICGFYDAYDTISNCYNTAKIMANSATGGICGYAYSSIGDINNCYNSGEIVSLTAGSSWQNYGARRNCSKL